MVQATGFKQKHSHDYFKLIESKVIACGLFCLEKISCTKYVILRDTGNLFNNVIKISLNSNCSKN